MSKKKQSPSTKILNDKQKRIGRRSGQPPRDTYQFPMLVGYGGNYIRHQQLRPNTFNLRYFSHTPYVRKAMDTLINPITLHEWEIKPSDGTKLNSEIKRQIAAATACFKHPNHDDSFESLLTKIIEDWCVLGAGCIEHQLSSDPIRPIWMWPVDSQSIFVYPGWEGGKNEARYFQLVGFNNLGMMLDQGIPLRNDELVYILSHPSNNTPYGFGPVQVAFDSISRILGTGQYAGNLAANAQPENMLWMGRTDPTKLASLRAWWRNEIEGQGQTPIVGGETEPKILKLHSGDDKSLYLEYQSFLIREIATAFGISPQNLGIEKDVNRSTGEVSQDRDWNQAIRPLAHVISKYLTREVLHGKLGWYQIEFCFQGLERDDELINAEIFDKRYKNNVITPNEERARLGWEPLASFWADKTFADTQVAMSAARGTKIVDDPALEKINKTKVDQSKDSKQEKMSDLHEDEENMD